jgi:Flp pilus assembly protein TadD
MSRKRIRQGASAPREEPERPAFELDAVEQLLHRARRLRRKGESRRAVVLLRQACNLDEWRARSWTLLGWHLSELGRRDEALRALQQARWLRTRSGDKARADVTARLADQVLAAAA